MSPPFVGAPGSDIGLGASTKRRNRLKRKAPEDPIADLIRAHRRVHPKGDARLLRRSYEVAERMHRGQMRKSGDPYITHPLAVAQILADLGMDTTTLVAALLHDTVEDTSYDIRTLTNDFGREVALLVDGVTKLDKASFGEAAEAETIRKMMVRAGQDVRVLIIKVADRVHNMRTLDARSPASRARIARATLDVLVPLCDRLGIQALKRSLEDTVLSALEPEAYADIHEHVNNRPLWSAALAEAVRAVSRSLAAARVDARVAARPRHYYSIWKDTIDAGFPLDHDPPRLVIIVEGQRNDCYAALGAMHAMWRPVPGRFKDFIASPKNNLYQSLHTTLLGPGNQTIEILIRTEAMHHSAEYGIAANFRDPSVAARLDPRDRAEQLAWIRGVVNWQSHVEDAGRFLDALRCDLSERQIQVFTPKGKVVLLPTDATPVDVAYTLDPELGHACIAARRGGRLVPLSSRLSDGDVVEILTRDNDAVAVDRTYGPAREWLEFVTSPHARLEITRWFQTADSRSAAVLTKPRLGRNLLAAALREEDRVLAHDGPLIDVATDLGYPDLDVLFADIADQTVSAADVVGKLIARVDHPRADPPIRL